MSLLRVMNTTSRVAAMHPGVTASVRRTSARYGQMLLQGGVSTTAADSADRSRHSGGGSSTHMAPAASAAATSTTRCIGTKKKDIGAKANEEEMRPGDRSQVLYYYCTQTEHIHVILTIFSCCMSTLQS